MSGRPRRGMSFSEPTTALRPALIRAPSVGPMRFRHAVVDSRKAGRGDIFIALRGERVDGHDFVAHAASRGATGAIVERQVDADIAQYVVPSPLTALQQLARLRRLSRARLKVVAITGSVGKTTTKVIAAHVLAARRRIAPYLTPTALNRYPALDELASTEVWVKHENHQPIGAFKVRGGVVYFDRRRPRRGVISATPTPASREAGSRSDGFSVPWACPQWPTVTKMWHVVLLMRLPRPLARAWKRLSTGPFSTWIVCTFSSSMSAPLLCSAFAIALSSTFLMTFAAFFGVNARMLSAAAIGRPRTRSATSRPFWAESLTP